MKLRKGGRALVEFPAHGWHGARVRLVSYYRTLPRAGVDLGPLWLVDAEQPRRGYRTMFFGPERLRPLAEESTHGGRGKTGTGAAAQSAAGGRGRPARGS